MLLFFQQGNLDLFFKVMWWAGDEDHDHKSPPRFFLPVLAPVSFKKWEFFFFFLEFHSSLVFWIPILSTNTVHCSFQITSPPSNCWARFKKSSAQLRALALQRRWQWGWCYLGQSTDPTINLCFWLDFLWGLLREKVVCVSQILSQELNTGSK